MNGFKDSSLNQQIANKILNHIIMKIFECCNLMLQDCCENNIKIPNKEEDIRDYLYYNYLNCDDVMRKINFNNFRFFPEVPENYINNKPLGRVDLHVFSINDFYYRNRYFIIECKRIDGNMTLNRKYLDEGVRRFVGDMPTYNSYYKVNCMFGFLTKDIDISQNVNKLNLLWKTDYQNINVEDYLHTGIIPDTYVSSHTSKGGLLILTHAFFNCTPILI